jgi:hypothetical protein
MFVWLSALVRCTLVVVVVVVRLGEVRYRKPDQGCYDIYNVTILAGRTLEREVKGGSLTETVKRIAELGVLMYSCRRKSWVTRVSSGWRTRVRPPETNLAGL